MPPQQSNTSIGDWTKFLAMLSLALGAWWVEPVLHSNRPSARMETIEHHFIQDVDARLWQDPLAAVTQTSNDKIRGHGKRDLSWLKKVVIAGNTQLVIGAMVHGGASPEQMENRRRTRYAVLAALNKHRYVPSDPEHIGYIKVGTPPKACPQSFPPMAFERFELDKQTAGNQRPETPRNILLLWLTNDVFEAESYDEKQRASYPADPKDCLQAIFDQLEVSPILIGPADSATLRRLGQKSSTKPQSTSQKPDFRASFRVYSPFATAALTEDLPTFKPPFQDNWHLTRTIASNDLFAKELIAELKQRKIAPPQTLALIGQWDTEYSRDLIEQFKTQWHGKLLAHNYLRGVDGRLPNDSVQKEQKTKDSSQTGAQGNAPDAIERPEGDQQMDYLRRIVEELQQQEAELFSQCSVEQRIQRACGIRAIGILGNDYYDKLLTLQALRKKFPDTLFFTTDLEAAMLHPQDNADTRNLIVASGYDLTLTSTDNPDHALLQGEIPPFRNSYQTAVFYSVQLALCESPDYHNSQADACDKIEQMTQYSKFLKPLLFEIGRTAAITLGDKVPGVTTLPILRHAPLFLAIIGFILLVSWSFFGDRTLWLKLQIAAAFVAAAVMSIVFLIYWIKNQSLEPLLWFEGVSIWPSELLRLISLFLSTYLLVKIFFDLRQCKAELTATFYPSGRYVPRSRLRRPLSYVFLIDYVENVCWQKTIKTAIPQALGMFFLSVVLMLEFGFPKVPVRGDWEFEFDLILTAFSVSASLLLLFSVVRITFLTTVLAKNLSGKTRWPSEVMEAHGVSSFGRHYSDDWLDVLLIARVTEPVGRIIFYPIWPLLLLYTARSPLFDNWGFPPALIIGITVTLAIAFYNAWHLRHMAEEMRSGGLRRLNKNLLKMLGKPGEAHDQIIAQLRMIIERVTHIREGAFAPLSEQPAVQALLTAVSAVSGLKLAEYFTFF
ncbi:hypothetical protein [Methylomicrobium lacus]|uniref:hypothetical protein n=1 Tax=Methylomicrobium lacus TaxID=136992 RepID=UPI0035A9532F